MEVAKANAEKSASAVKGGQELKSFLFKDSVASGVGDGVVGAGNELLAAFAAGKVLQYVTVCCTSVLQYVEMCVVQCVAVWCSVVQCGAVWCSVMQCDARGARNELLAAFAAGKLLQSVAAVCYRMLKCIAVCCSVVQ